MEKRKAQNMWLGFAFNQSITASLCMTCLMWRYLEGLFPSMLLSSSIFVWGCGCHFLSAGETESGNIHRPKNQNGFGVHLLGGGDEKAPPYAGESESPLVLRPSFSA